MSLQDYAGRFKTVRATRTDDGVLLVRLHSRDGPLQWGALPHQEITDLFQAVAEDPDNRVVVLTGTREDFIALPQRRPGDASHLDMSGPRDWDRRTSTGARLIWNMLSVDVPMVAAVNGPVAVHSELALLCDVVLCAPETTFGDTGHFAFQLVPGDGTHVVWTALLGLNRARHALLTGEVFDAAQALQMGLVSEIVEPSLVVSRAIEIAAVLARRDPIYLKYTRQLLLRPLRRAMAEDLPLGLALEALAGLARTPET